MPSRNNLMRRTREAPTSADPSHPVLPRLGVIGGFRWAWRQLTSMRAALFLLLLLAVGAVPGSIWPQRNIDPVRVANYLIDHPNLGPWLDRLGMFDVFSSPWFASIYLLLTVSLIGCVVPRSRQHWRLVRAEPPHIPARLERLPHHVVGELDRDPQRTVKELARTLRKRGYRVRVRGLGDQSTLSAEGGYVREVGNLVFHAALLLLVVAIAIGHLWGWRGDVILPVGQTFSSTLSAYDTIDPGPLVNTSRLPQFQLALDRFDVSFEDRAVGAQFGAPRDFTAAVSVAGQPDAPSAKRTVKVNRPLSVDGSSVYLLGNGYAPHIVVRDATGKVVYDDPTPFLPQDNTYRSVGAVKVTGASPQQLGFAGFFLPSAVIDKQQGPISVFPGLRAPALILTAWQGNLFPGGRPQSVYSLNTTGMSQIRTATGEPVRIWLTPGATVQLPDGLGSISLTDIPRWAGLSVRHQPGKSLALWSSLVALAGLICSLTIRRRRIFARIEVGWALRHNDIAPQTRIRLAAVAKGPDPGLSRFLNQLLPSATETKKAPDD